MVAEKLVEEGKWLLSNNQKKNAEKFFDQALRLDPANDEIRQLLSLVR